MAYIGVYRDGWRAQVQRDGERKTKTFKLKRQAQAWANEMESKRLFGMHTFRQACDDYLATISKRKTEKAHAWESQRFHYMCEHFGAKTDITEISTATIGKWRDTRLQTVTGSTVNREANLLRNLFSVACDEWKWIPGNPFKGVKLPKESAPRVALWPWQQIKRILRAPRIGKTAEMQMAFRISLHTGMRLQECLMGRYDAKRRVVVLPYDKTTKRPVEVPVVSRSRRFMETTRPFIVGFNEGSTLFSKLSRELLIEGLTFHDARATALTLLARKMDVLTLARISRHKDLNILLNTYFRESAESVAARN